MEFFPGGGFVRLQSRANRKYIHADGDWKGVSLRPLSAIPSLEAVWRAEHWVSNRGAVFLLLQNAAYGRYLSFSLHPARRGRMGRRVVQRDFDDPSLVDAFLWRWKVRRVDPDQDYVRLLHFNFHLRANGRYLTWLTAVTATGFTLCIRPGSHGRLMPLATYLPRSVHTLSIVVLRTGSPAAAALVYPQINPPPQ